MRKRASSVESAASTTEERERKGVGNGRGGQHRGMEIRMGRNGAAERHERRRGKNEARALFRARVRRGGPIAAKCREIVILQSQREFTLATGEI